MSRTTLTGSGTMCVRSTFLVPLRDASESFFFFPMVMRWRAVVKGGSGGISGVGGGRDYVGHLLKAGRAWDTMSLMAAQKYSRRPPGLVRRR
jgi:hypothetical protein